MVFWQPAGEGTAQRPLTSAQRLAAAYGEPAAHASCGICCTRVTARAAVWLIEGVQG